MKGGKPSDKETSNCLKPYWLTIVVMNARRLSCCAPTYQSATHYEIDRVVERVSSWGGSSYYWQFFNRLTYILYSWKMIFYKLLSNFLIHSGTETISYMRMCVRVAVCGIPLYFRNTARRHVRVYVCVYIKLPNHDDFAYGWPLVPLGFGFYIFI